MSYGSTKYFQPFRGQGYHLRAAPVKEEIARAVDCFPEGDAGKDFALLIAKVVLAALLDRDGYALTGPALNPNEAMPYGYNHFAVRIARSGMAEKI